jgi:hypothetical protein
MDTMKPALRPSILWCPNSRGTGWKFPRAVRNQLVEDCRGLDVLHLFGGQADFGTRLDIDWTVRPHVLGDAWLPPFARNSFDVVILDPPYFHMNANMKVALFRAAAWVARKRLVWFSTLWMSQAVGLTPEASWLVRVGDNCYVRCLQYFHVNNARKLPPVKWFNRGPAMKYNKWVLQPESLPLRFTEGTQ